MTIITDIIYATLLLVSVLAGNFVLRIGDIQRRKYVCGAFGGLLVLLVSGWYAIHPVLVTVINAFIITLCPPWKRTEASFIFCFGYLIYFKYLKAYGLNPPPDITNSIQMMLTLKMVGLAIELEMLKQKHSTKSSPEQIYEEGDMRPKFWDDVCYAFCYVGVLVGPYYRYRTYRDFFNAPYLELVDRKSMCFDRLKVLPIYLVFWLILQRLFPVDYVNMDEFYEHGLAYKLLYLTPVFIIFRLRLYMGFILGECVCMSAGVGLYPTSSKPAPGAGPTDITGLLQVWQGQTGHWAKEEFDYETVHNIDEVQAEFSVSMREGIRHWNRTVQYWLAVYFYKRLPLPRPLRTLLTMTLSAVWHGIQPGYFLCLVTSTAFMVGEEAYDDVQRSLTGIGARLAFRFVRWFCKMQSFTYMLVAFLLLDLDKVYHYYREVYFLGHIYIILLLLFRAYIHRQGRKLESGERLWKAD